VLSCRVRRVPWLILALVALVAIGACGPQGRSRSSTSGSARTSAPSARSVLAAYLDATFGGHHERAWNLLTRADQQRTARAGYVEEQRNLAATRAQVAALGKAHHRIGKLTEQGDRASATVVLTSGLGRESLRFVLRRERGRWRVDYRESWSTP